MTRLGRQERRGHRLTMPVARVSSRFQIVVPKTLRDKFGIKAGTRFLVTEKDGSIVCTPGPDDPISYLCGVFEDGPSMTQELLEERRRDLEHE